jgi:hypothetical protein
MKTPFSRGPVRDEVLTARRSRAGLRRNNLTTAHRGTQTIAVARARRHQTFLARLALGLLALVAELAGRSLTHRIDVGRHLAAPSYDHADYYPILMAVVKVGVALMLARVAWRFVKARSVATAATKLLVARGHTSARARPRMRIELSSRLWLGAFLATASIFLLQMDAERISTGRWPLLAPWLHTSALPVFAVLAVIVAFVYGVVARWLSDYETYARQAAAEASRACVEPAPMRPRASHEETAPRSRFGLAFESRPPPAPA